MKIIPSALIAAILAGPAIAEMSLSFEWGDIPFCHNGRPNTVGSPAFVLTGVPEGTTKVQFKLKDLNVPGFNHGGGSVATDQDGQLPFGLFTYKSPCPPGRVHTYEWTAIAKAGNKTLAKTTAQRNYPE